MQSLDSMLSYRFMSVYSILPLDISPALSIIWILYFLVNVHVIKHSEIFHCVDKLSKDVIITQLKEWQYVKTTHIWCVVIQFLNIKNCIIIDYVYTSRGIWNHIGICPTLTYIVLQYIKQFRPVHLNSECCICFVLPQTSGRFSMLTVMC